MSDCKNKILNFLIKPQRNAHMKANSVVVEEDEEDEEEKVFGPQQSLL